MENDCEIYVDPEEDEVFFGCVSDREKTVSTKLVKPTDCSSDNDSKLSKVLDEVIILDDDDENVDENTKNSLKNAESGSTPKETTAEASESPVASPTLSSNTSVDLDHNYSTPMKHKIDKSILATPKTVVKADKDGGFLKVLSEIALVKAEVEADKNCNGRKEDEDKENQISKIPEIKVTEATPEKRGVMSPQKNFDMELRRFRIIYNSPRNENVESLECEKNILNKTFDKDKGNSIDLIDFNELVSEAKDAEIKKTVAETEETAIVDRKNSKSAEITRSEPILKIPKGLRFSKEARKIVEVLKKSSVDDTLNFTIPEIDVEEDNSFLSPEPVPTLELTVVANDNVEPPRTYSKVAPTPESIRLPVKSKTDVKRNGGTAIPFQNKQQPGRYFSERKLYNQTESEVKKKCVKKLPLDENKIEKGGKLVEPSSGSVSKIPVFGLKSSKIPLSQRVARPATAKTTPSKTPVGKSFKNSKFNHIESPINAYIHNKPTTLVLNVKPELKKGNLNKILKVESSAGAEKQQSKLQNPKCTVRLPFVEYKSATPYKIEKRGESRLPRLAPTVMKLISSHSPKVVKHEGRFYLNSPRKGRSGENTIVADQNEVSVVVSQPAQKSNTIK